MVFLYTSNQFYCSCDWRNTFMNEDIVSIINLKLTGENRAELKDNRIYIGHPKLLRGYWLEIEADFSSNGKNTTAYVFHFKNVSRTYITVHNLEGDASVVSKTLEIFNEL